MGVSILRSIVVFLSYADDLVLFCWEGIWQVTSVAERVARMVWQK